MNKLNLFETSSSESPVGVVKRIHAGAQNLKMAHVPNDATDRDHLFEHPQPARAAANLANYLRGFGHKATADRWKDEDGHIYNSVRVKAMGEDKTHYVHVDAPGKWSVHHGMTKALDLFKKAVERKFIPGEDCPHCGASMERSNGNSEEIGECNSCGKDWPSNTWASPKLSGDGGQGWHCPWCGEVNCSDTPEIGRGCYKCKKPVDVVDESRSAEEGDKPSGKNWHVYPAPPKDSELRKSIVLGPPRCNNCDNWLDLDDDDAGLNGFCYGCTMKAKREKMSKAVASGFPLEGRRQWQGMNVSVENRAGSWREDKHNTPPKWKTKMVCDYGYLRGTEGTDGDHLDCFFGHDPNAENVYIVNQVEPKTGKFDEQKVMLDFPDVESAKAMYLQHYDTPAFFGSIQTMPVKEFKEKALATLHGEKMVKSAFRKSQFNLFDDPIPVQQPHHYDEVNGHRKRERGHRQEEPKIPTLFDEPDNKNLYIVPNHWGPVFHIADAKQMSWPPAPHDERGYYDHERAQLPEYRNDFKTIQEALDFARARGVEPHIDPRCKKWHEGPWPEGSTISEQPDFTNKYKGSTPVHIARSADKKNGDAEKRSVGIPSLFDESAKKESARRLADVMFIPPASSPKVKIREVKVPQVIEDAMQQGATLAVSISGGKDSQALINVLSKLHKERGWKGHIFAIHADLGRAEWPQTPGVVEQHAEENGLPLQVVTRNDGRDLVDHIEARMAKLAGTDAPGWPSSKARYCTSHLKAQPIDIALRAASDGGESKPVKTTPGWPSSASRYCTSDLKRGPIDVALRAQHASSAAPAIIISAEGVRAAESRERAKKPVVELRKQITAGSKEAEKNLRDMSPEDALKNRQEGQRVAFDWRPLHDWSDEDVWNAIGHTSEELENRRKLYKLGRKDDAMKGWKAHPAYVLGNQRLSCVFCVLGSKNDLKNGAIHNPELFEKYKEMERTSGSTFKHKFSLADLDLNEEYPEEESGVLPCDGCGMHKSLFEKAVSNEVPHHYITIGNRRIRVFGRRLKSADTPSRKARRTRLNYSGGALPSMFAPELPDEHKTEFSEAEVEAFVRAHGAAEKALGIIEDGADNLPGLGRELATLLADGQGKAGAARPFFVGATAADCLRDIDVTARRVSAEPGSSAPVAQLRSELLRLVDVWDALAGLLIQESDVPTIKLFN